MLLARQLSERGRRSGVPITIPPPLLEENDEEDDEDGNVAEENKDEVVGDEEEEEDVVEEYTPFRSRGSCTVGQNNTTTDIGQIFG